MWLGSCLDAAQLCLSASLWNAASRAAATRSLGPDDSLAHCVLSLWFARPQGAPRDAKEAGAKVYPRSHFPRGPGVPHESSQESSRRRRVPRRLFADQPRTLRQRWAAPLNRAAWTPRAATDSRSVTTTTRRHRRVAHSCPDDWLPGRLAACIAHSCTGGLDSATPWRTPWPCSNRRKR